MIDDNSNTQESSEVSASRRAFLVAGASVGATALSGCLLPTGSGSGSVPPAGPTNNSTNATSGNFQSIDPQPLKGEFDRVVTMTKAGADPTGEEDVSPVIEREIGDNTLLYFPPGRYKMNSQVAYRGGRNLGIVGQNATLCHGKVTAIHGYEVRAGEFRGKAQHFKIGSSDNPHQGTFIFGGFTADWRGKNAGMQVLHHQTTGQSEIRSIRQVGIHDLGCQGPIRVNPVTENASIRVSNLDLRFGGLTYQKTINTRKTRSLGGPKGRSIGTTGIAGHPRTQGTLRVQNCMVGGWPDNGIYLIGGHPGKGDGTIDIRNCIAANSQAANIRIGGDGSMVHNCAIITDNMFDEDFYFEQRPLRLDDGSITVTNTKIIQKNPTGWALTVQHGVEKAVIQNVEVTIKDTPMKALVVDDAVNQATVKDFVITTPGWNATKQRVIRNGGARLTNVFLDGEKIA